MTAPTDGTPAILARLRDRYANLSVVQGAPLAEGWLGKPHALQQGVGASTGEFLLLADADVIYAQGVHRSAALEMVRRNLDIVTLLPAMEGKGFEPLVLSFLDAFAFYGSPTFLANVPCFKFLGFGAGSGMVVRREALEGVGGVECIKAQVVDDVALGRAIKRLRGRMRVIVAIPQVRVRMYDGFAAAVEGFTKNLYAVAGHHPLLALPITALYLTLHVAPPLALAVALTMPGRQDHVLPAAIASGLELALNLGSCCFSGQPVWVAFAAPVRAIVWGWILLRSMWRYHTRGVVWRGRVYRE